MPYGDNVITDKDGNTVYCLACSMSFEHHTELVGTSYAALAAGCMGWHDPRLTSETQDAEDVWEDECPTQ